MIMLSLFLLIISTPLSTDISQSEIQIQLISSTLLANQQLDKNQKQLQTPNVVLYLRKGMQNAIGDSMAAKANLPPALAFPLLCPLPIGFVPILTLAPTLSEFSSS